MARNHAVIYHGSVRNLLSDSLCSKLTGELLKVFESNPPPRRILVSRCFGGYTPDFENRIVVGVEVQQADDFATHIVKLGKASEVQPDFDNWVKCTRQRQVASRIFSPVGFVPDLPGGRVAVLYRDAYTLFGRDDEKGRPESLETVAERAVRSDSPNVLSVERAIAHIYTDLSRWFYEGAKPDRKAAAMFYRNRLRMHKPASEQILELWRRESKRMELRRAAVWVICGRDRPDADPLAEPPRYLDPVDFVEWAIKARDGSRLPETLIGRSHGDLHGRNVLVGVRRGEAEYPAVYDYGEMRPDNALVWDFAKLETELKVRLLPAILDDAAVCARLLGDRLPAPAAVDRAVALPSSEIERATRLVIYLAFEELLHALTARIQSYDQAESLLPFPAGYQTGVAKLDHLLAILWRIRKEAARCLGFDRHQRGDKWQDELYFSLAVYGLLNVRWNYEWQQAECALVAAGVAAARMPSTPTLLANQVANRHASGDFPSYRVPLCIAHKCWKAQKYEEGRDLVEAVVFDVRISDGERSEIAIRPDRMHAVPLIAEGALLELECGLSRLAEPLLESIRPLAREFGDYETLGRLGRLFKDSGDRRWEQSLVPFASLAETTAWQMYGKALKVYEEAFLATGDYYTGINAATLALLTGERTKARKYAAQVARQCKQDHEIKSDDRFWVFATEGEAQLILENWDRATKFYADALAELTPGQGGMANSSYKQLCRLWKVFESEAKAEKIVQLFERSEFCRSLTPVLGRKLR